MTEITNIKKNIMGTTSFDMKTQGMRKPQGFSVYPIQKNDTSETITIQSAHRFGYINMATGRGVLSGNHAQHANSIKFALDKIKGQTLNFQLSDLDLSALKMHIFVSAGAKVGESVIFCDNSGATRIL